MSQATLPLYYLKPQGMTQSSIAEHTGLCRQTLGQYFTGKTAVSQKVVPVLADLFGVDEQQVINSSALTMRLAREGALLKEGRVADVESVQYTSLALVELDDSQEPRQTLADLFISKEVRNADVVKATGWRYSAVRKYRKGLSKMRVSSAEKLSNVLGLPVNKILAASEYTVLLAGAKLLGDRDLPMSVEEFRTDPRASQDRSWRPSL